MQGLPELPEEEQQSDGQAPRYPRLAQINAIVAEASNLLEGKHPAIQSAALAELTAMWLCSVPSDGRDEFLGRQIKLVRDLVPILLEEERAHKIFMERQKK